MPGKAIVFRPPLAMVWSGALLLGLLVLAVWSWQGPRFGSRQADDHSLEDRQVFGILPDFSLIERSGRRVTLADLRGKVWVADFIYTHCTDTCPLQSAEMARLQADLGAQPDVRLVTITVDPAQDTPEVLAEYANRFGADRERWLFLTGQKRSIYDLAEKGFMLSVEDPSEAVPATPGQPLPARPDPGGARSSTPWRPTSLMTASGLAEILASFVGATPAMAHPGHLSAPFLHSSWFVLVDHQARIRGYYRSDDEKAMRRLRGDVRALLQENR
jgi:cytochrome oxidase Cu insertion factor (SCO1/SenC/PrrC family)